MRDTVHIGVPLILHATWHLPQTPRPSKADYKYKGERTKATEAGGAPSTQGAKLVRYEGT